jgi:hypothetical protein
MHTNYRNSRAKKQLIDEYIDNRYAAMVSGPGYVLPHGKYAGKQLSEVPESYLLFCLAAPRTSFAMLRRYRDELDRRRAPVMHAIHCNIESESNLDPHNYEIIGPSCF